MKLISKHINIICRKLGMNSEVEHMADGFTGKRKSEGKGTNLIQCKAGIFYMKHFCNSAAVTC